MSDLLPCGGGWYSEGCLSSIRVTEQHKPHMHTDGLLHIRCSHDRHCQVPGHTQADHQPRIGSRFD